jgi:hypothetical protein
LKARVKITTYYDHPDSFPRRPWSLNQPQSTGFS